MSFDGTKDSFLDGMWNGDVLSSITKTVTTTTETRLVNFPIINCIKEIRNIRVIDELHDDHLTLRGAKHVAEAMRQYLDDNGYKLVKVTTMVEEG